MKVRRLTEAKKLNELKRKLREDAGPTLASTAERELFRDALAQSQGEVVRPLKQKHDQYLNHLLAPKLQPDAAMRRLDDAMVMDELLEPPQDLAALDGSEQMAYLANGYSPKLLRKLRAGDYRVSDEFDLHHMIATDAKKALHLFLHQAKHVGMRCVRIIHGKGLRSGDDGPVLKSMVDSELRRRKDVIAFVSAKPHQGGTGAVVILLTNQ